MPWKVLQYDSVNSSLVFFLKIVYDPYIGSRPICFSTNLFENLLKNKLACSQCMGLHSSDGKNTAALTQRPWVRIPLKSLNVLAGLFANA